MRQSKAFPTIPTVSLLTSCGVHPMCVCACVCVFFFKVSWLL
jgi:hypothetical protein